MTFSPEIRALAAEAEAALRHQFDYIDNVSYENTARVMAAFAEHRVSEAIFQPSSGYGYNDRGRDTLDRIWADVMGAEAAFVRHQIVNGTQALAIGLFGLLQALNILSGVPILALGVPAVLSVYFDVFSGFVQALVFTLLSMVYIAGSCPEPEAEEAAA